MLRDVVSTLSPSILTELLAARAESPEGDPVAGNRPYLAAWSKSDTCACQRSEIVMGLTAAEKVLERARVTREAAVRAKAEAAGETVPKVGGPCACFNFDTLDIYNDRSDATWQKRLATAPYKVFIYNLHPETSVKELMQGLCRTGRASAVEIFREQVLGTGQVRFLDDEKTQKSRLQKLLEKQKMSEIRVSKVYAWVHFKDESHYRRALSYGIRLLGIDIKGHECRTQGQEDKCSLNLGNLPQQRTDAMGGLQSMLEHALLQHPLYEGIESVGIKRVFGVAKEGRQKHNKETMRNGFCSVDFYSHDEAMLAYRALQTIVLDDSDDTESADKPMVRVSWGTFSSPAVFGEPRDEESQLDSRRSSRWLNLAPAEPEEDATEVNDASEVGAINASDEPDDLFLFPPCASDSDVNKSSTFTASQADDEHEASEGGREGEVDDLFDEIDQMEEGEVNMDLEADEAADIFDEIDQMDDYEEEPTPNPIWGRNNGDASKFGFGYGGADGNGVDDDSESESFERFESDLLADTSSQRV
jgi:RNA recognition motif-containing protein